VGRAREEVRLQQGKGALMQKIIIDESLRTKLNNCDTELEFLDESGKTLGFFVPPEWHHELLYAWAKAQVTDQELEEARLQPGGQPLSEILEKLEQG